MSNQYLTSRNNIYISFAFLFLALSFSFFKYYTTKSQWELEVEKSKILQDSLNSINVQQGDYKQYLEAVNHLVKNENEAAQTIFQKLSNSPDSLIVSGLKISSILNRPEIIVIAKPQITQKSNEISEPMEITEPPVQKTVDKVEVIPTIIPAEKKEAIDKPIYFKSSKGVKIEYAGQVVNNKANGYGVGLFESGGVYKGNWQNNKRHGKGVYIWKDGEKYEGDFVGDKREGFGIYTWKNGEKYEGQWKNDMRDGKGTLYKANGDIKIAGLFIKDNLQ